MTMTPTGTRLLADLRHQLLDPIRNAIGRLRWLACQERAL